ncbi:MULTISPECIES: TRAP transporter small permease [Robinsoniella]|uniref:TRAP transporter small permease n=1 Tax=Robinsoniella TaxID=588605 RepID=UPI0004818B8B|nr:MULTISPECIES: TRAP transporter small permease [Robinsoniella]
MTNIFSTIDKMKPIYDAVYKFTLLLCKLILVIDILITSVTVLGRYVSFIPDPAWSEEIVLTCMAYLAVLSAALAIRNGSHIRMTALDKYMPKKVVISLDIIADIAIFILAIVMIIVGWRYAVEIGSKGSYVSITWLSRFWKYFPVPLAGVAMVIFEIEVFYQHAKKLFTREEIADESR